MQTLEPQLFPAPRVPFPQGGASLMIAYQCKQKSVLVVGNTSVAASRVLACLEADAQVTLVGPKESMCSELLYRVNHSQVDWIGDVYVPSMLKGRDLVFACQADLGPEIAEQCHKLRIPVNVADMNNLCDFYMTSTYRDQSLQIAVSTNGQASKLSNRVKRHITAQLPNRLGDAVRRVGVLRQKVRSSDPSRAASSRRMKWLAQICEYWSMDRLALLSDQDMEKLLEAYHNDEGYESLDMSQDPTLWSPPSQIGSHKSSDRLGGSITLVGSGPGDPDLLTIAARKAIKEADLVLSDKIVPAEVVALVECELKIARKFPGNADAAQNEFNSFALRALKEGKRVVRLKQGDPFLFGRGGEEVLFFRKHGYIPKVIPGISSAVAAPLLASIPLTHRSVASQFLVSTGTGAKNTSAPLPVYDKHRTDVFLMAIHRLEAFVEDLIQHQEYPANVPCAIIERASCVDQRVIWGNLERIVSILDGAGGSRPPGLLVVGHAIDVLKHTDNGCEGIATSLMASPDIHCDRSLLQLHDPEGTF